MSQGQFVAGWFTPVQGSLPPLPERPGWTPEHPWVPGGPGEGGEIEPPIVLPPLPPGMVMPPIALPPTGEAPEYPIYIPSTPEHPIQLPPGTVWPPFNPGDALHGKVLLLVWVPGTGKHKWVVVEVPTTLPPLPPIPGAPGQPLPR